MSNKKVLILVDLQNDFSDFGMLGFSGLDTVVQAANQLINSGQFDWIVASQDWHPAEHKSFAANHYFRYPKQWVDLEGGVHQQLWPIHCVQGTYGAQLVAELQQTHIDQVVQKGQDPLVDAYGCFKDNQKQVFGDLATQLKHKEIKEVVVLGVSLEHGVQFTALQAKELGLEVSVVKDACCLANFGEDDVAQAYANLKANGVQLTELAHFLD